MSRTLDGREYKMLLNPAKFSGEFSLEDATNFWTEQLKPVIERRLGHDGDGETRARGKFNEEKRRTIRYWDTNDCLLTSAQLTLRLRKQLSKPDQLTLKLRMTDYVIVATTDLPGAGDVSPEFEEDIAPLEVQTARGTAAAVARPGRRSTRSRFALSTSVPFDWDNRAYTIGDLESAFPTIGELLKAGGTNKLASRLDSGPIVHEAVFEGAKVKLSSDVKAEFDLTIWNFEGASTPKKVVEISFKYPSINGEISSKAATRALELFIGMQDDLGDWVNPKHSSKTALALPSPCGKMPD